MIIHCDEDIFSFECDIITHACNCSGNWGRGFAEQLATRFPLAYKQHREEAPYKVGDWQSLAATEDKQILCLFTSSGYGRYKDSREKILEQTESSLVQWSNTIESKAIVASPQINAGLFGVPWPMTESIIEKICLANSNIEWHLFTLSK